MNHNKILKTRITEPQLKRIHKVASDKGIGVSDLVRATMKEACDMHEFKLAMKRHREDGL